MLLKSIKRVLYKGLDFINKVFVYFKKEMGDERFLKEAFSIEYKFRNLKDFANYFRNRSFPKFFIEILEREKVISLFKKQFLETMDEIIKEAEKICNHIFNILGKYSVNLGEIINWHCDFNTGYCWNPQTYYKDIKIPYGRADIKVPWELSRFNHLSILGMAYWLSNNKKYVEEFVNEITDWINNNKPSFGVNWRCTMDVAIRACNWIVGYYFFKNSEVLKDEFLVKFLKSLYQHGVHIIKNLEYNKGSLTTNHYLSDIVGLIYLGTLFPEFKDAKKWKDFGIKGLVEEMGKQVYSDGCDFEASTCYHRLVMELFFFATLIVVINNKDFNGTNYMEVAKNIFGQEYIEKLYKMFEVVLYTLKPNGRMPQIGDNDSGRFHIFAKQEVLDMRYLLSLGAIFFKEWLFKLKEYEISQEALWIFGEKGMDIWQNLGENTLINIGSKAFVEGGLFVCRNGRDYCLISCGANGQNGNGGHSHNDKLSFELCIDGKDIIVDPGTYIYTAKPSWRNKFRSTAYHNTVIIDDEEQNNFNDKNLFELKDNTKARCLKWESDTEKDIFIGEHCGYKRLASCVVHQREIRFYKRDKILEVIDRFIGKGRHNLKWNLFLHPDFKGELEIASEKLSFYKESGFYSPEYGVINETQKFSSTVETLLPAEFNFKIKVNIH